MRGVTSLGPVAFLAAAGLALTSCRPEPPPPPPPPPPVARTVPRPSVVPPARTSVSAPPGPAGVVGGSSFNKLFPTSGTDGYKLVYTQEKKGFAQAEISKGGQKAATLSISDVAANPEATRKFQQGGRQIGGYPAADVGSQGTAVLVGNRFQVQVRSNSAAFSPSDREAWLTKFKLDDLARLAGGR